MLGEFGLAFAIYQGTYQKVMGIWEKIVDQQGEQGADEC